MLYDILDFWKVYDILDFKLLRLNGRSQFDEFQFYSLVKELIEEDFAIGQLLERKSKGHSYEVFDHDGRIVGGLEFHESPVGTRLIVAYARSYTDRIFRATKKIGLDLTEARPVSP